MSLTPKKKKKQTIPKSKKRKSTTSKKYEAPKSFFRVCDAVEESGGETFLVGGIVRDMAFHTINPETEFKSGDYDIATNLLPDDIIDALRSKGIPTIEVGKQFGTIVAHTKDEDYEVTTYRLEGEYEKARKPNPDEISFVRNLEEDLARRDFTVNALAIDAKNLRGVKLPIKSLTEVEIVDPFGGVRDLRDGIIRTVGNPDDRFQDDALRMFRLARFSAKLNLTPTRETIQGARRNAELIRQVSDERIKMELDKLMKTTKPSRGFDVLDDINVLPILFPEISKLKGVEQQGDWHKYDVYRHTMETVDAVDNDFIKSLFPDRPDMIENLKLAALFHDAGKPDSREIVDGKIRFIGHEKMSGEIARNAMTRLKSSTRQKNMVTDIAKYHMIFCDENTHTEKTLRRLLNKFAVKYGEEDGVAMVKALIAIRHADIKGADGSESTDGPKLSKMLEKVVAKQGTKPVKLAVNGLIIKKWIGEDQHPREIGRAIQYLTEKVIEEPSFNNPKDLERLLRER